jgi:FkbM family methyltransferase
MMNRLVEWYISTPEHRRKYSILRRALRLVDGRPIRSRYGVLLRSESWDNTNFYAISGDPKVDYADVYEEVRGIRPGMAFIDIGANAGVFSMVAAKLLNGTGPIVAFEPSLSNFFKLIHNASLNRVENFFPFRLAIGAATELTSFSEDATHSGKAHLDSKGASTVLQASFADILSLVEAIVADREIFIKIDVEGAEALIVKSLGRLLYSEKVRKVIVEIDRQYLGRLGSSADEIYALMDAAGLQPRRGLGSRDHFNEIFERV